MSLTSQKRRKARKIETVGGLFEAWISIPILPTEKPIQLLLHELKTKVVVLLGSMRTFLTQIADENWRYNQRMRVIAYLEKKFSFRREITPGYVDFLDYKLPSRQPNEINGE